MSEASDQAADIKQLAEAVLSARAALAAAEQSAKDYTNALAAGTAKIDRAKEVEIESARAIAKANAEKAQSALRAEADGTAASQRAAKAQADEAKAAVEAARAIEAAEKKKAQAAAEGAAKSAKLKELSVGALGGEETVEKYNKAKQALALAGDASLTTGQRMLAGASAARFAAGAVGALAGGLADFAAEARKASAELYLHDQRVQAIGTAYGALRRETAGAADVQAVFSLKQELAARGLRATDEQIVSLGRKMREYARDNQVSQSTAAQVIQQALDGDERAASRLGLTFENASTSSQRFSQTLAALANQQRGTAASAQTAAEAADQQEQASARAWGTLKKWTFEVTGLRLLEQTAGGLSEGLDRARQAIEGAARAQQQQTSATNAQAAATQRVLTAEEQRARTEEQHAATALAAAQADLRRLGEHIEALGPVITAQEEYNRALAEANSISRRTNENDTQLDQRRLEAANRLTAAIRRKQEEQARKDGELQAQRELGLAVQTARAHGIVVDSRQRGLTPARLYRDLQAEIAGFAQRENESTTEATQRLTQLLQRADGARQQAQQQAQEARERVRAHDELVRLGRELSEETDLAIRMGTRIAEIERRRFETGQEYINRRLEAQRELNQLALEGRAADDERRDANAAALRDKEEQRRILEGERRREQTDREIEAEQERERQRAAMNAAAVERERADALDQRIRESFNLAQEQSTTATQAMAAGAKSAYDAFGELASGIAGAVKAAADKGEDAGAAVAKYVDDWAGAKAIQWGLQAAEALAGAGVAYFIRPDAVPGLLASAAQYAGLAAVAGVTAAAIPNAPTTGAGGAAGGDRLAASSRSESSANAKGPSYVINVSGFVTREDVEDGLVRAMRSAQSRHGDFLRQ